MEEIKINLLEPQGIQKRPKRKIWFYIFLFFALVAILGAFNFTSSVMSLNKMSFSATGEHPSFFTQLKNLILSPDRQLKGEKEDRINILLLGIGGENHDGPYLSDTIILLSLQPSTKQIALLSIPRDLLVYVPGYGYGKINVANATGEAEKKGTGPVLAGEVVNKITGQPVNYYVRVDFQAFKELVNAVGGINLYVDKSFTDTQYPTYDYKIQTISFEKGWQEMDGERALEFSRSRHGNNGEGSDFARSRRQQKILLSLKDKIFSASTFLNPGRLEGIMGSLSKHVQTNIEPWEIMRFYKLTQKLDYENMINRVIEEGPNKPLLATFYNGANVLVPKNDNFDEIQRLAKNIFVFDATKLEETPATPAKTHPGPKIEIQNGTWILGLAAKTKVELEEKGYLIDDVGNAKSRSYATTTIYDLSARQYPNEIEKLKNELKAEIIKQPSSDLISTSTPNPDILIIIGSDRKL